MSKQPVAVVMNMFYTGLGIARSLGERGIPVIGLTSAKRVFGSYSRYARTVLCPDSRREPELLLPAILELGKSIRHGILFPTRDDDVVFMDRYRHQLEQCFVLAVPKRPVVKACLNKWETHKWAEATGVPMSPGWLVETRDDIDRVLAEAQSWPCVMKPLSSHLWHKGSNWELVGRRKAVRIESPEHLIAEYEQISRTGTSVLVEEMVPGADDCLVTVACYLNQNSDFIAGFNTQKLVQTPEGVGTGCILQTTECPELFERTARLLKAIGYTGIAEIEYKWDSRSREYQLIEVNSRPWDQHRLGNACGVDVVYLAYCELAGLPLPSLQQKPGTIKWVAEDALLMVLLQLVWNRDQRLGAWLRTASGKRIYAIWSGRDPLPSLVYMTRTILPGLVSLAMQACRSMFVRRRVSNREVAAMYERPLGDGKSHV